MRGCREDRARFKVVVKHEILGYVSEGAEKVSWVLLRVCLKRK